MLTLDDDKWKELHGGYKVPYDASIALRSMQDGIDVWDELWDELHHQGDVGIASYAAIPELVRIASRAPCRGWNFYSFLATIEVERHRKSNPAVPSWLQADYQNAWAEACSLALTDLNSTDDSETVQAMLSVLALAKGELKLGAMLSRLDTSEIEEWVDERLAWCELYAMANRLAELPLAQVRGSGRIPFFENTPGDFYVEDGCCTSCGMPSTVAPDLFSYADDGHCYVSKQPTNAIEMRQMIAAFEVQDVGCIRYKGINRVIAIKLIAAGEGDQCDELDHDLMQMNEEVKADRCGLGSGETQRNFLDRCRGLLAFFSRS